MRSGVKKARAHIDAGHKALPLDDAIGGDKMMDKAERSAALLGRRVLVVEDEPFIAMTLEDMLTDFGCVVVGSASQINEALAIIAIGELDAAVLDVNLGAQKIDPVADELARRGFPFVFTTGYGRTGVPSQHNGRGVVEKPFRAQDLATALAMELVRLSR